MSRFIDEALAIESYLNDSEFDRMTLPKVIGKTISTLPELTYEQCRAIVEAIKLPRSQKLTDKEFLAYKKKVRKQGNESPLSAEADLCKIMRETVLELDETLTDEQISEFEQILDKRAKEKGLKPYEPDYDKPIGVTEDGYMIYELARKGGRRIF